MRPWSITFAYDFPSPQGIHMLIAPGEDSYLFQMMGIEGMPLGNQAEIGVYRHALDGKKTNLLHQQIQKALGESSGPVEMAPGSAHLTFGLLKDEEESPNLAVFPLDQTLPPETSRFQDEMVRAGQEMLKHPYRTLQGKASWPQPSFFFRDEVRMILHLRNSGNVLLQIPNPAAGQTELEVGLTIYLEKNIPSAQMQDGDYATMPLLPGEVEQLAAPGALPGDEPQPLVTLDVGEELVLAMRVRRHFFITPGTYRGIIIYKSGHDEIPEDLAVAGLLAAPAGPVQVTAKP